MIVLGIETSGKFCGFAVAKDDETLGESLSDIAGKHVEMAVAMIGALLEEVSVGIDGLDGVAVSLGPGSFTGLRIGLGTAKGICFGTGLPLAGVPTLDCLAESLCPWSGYIIPVIDARRGEIYSASYRSEGGPPERISEYRALRPEQVAEEIAGYAVKARTLVAGDAMARYGDLLRDRLSAGAVIAEEQQWIPSAAVVARIGVRLIREGRVLDLESSEPLYLRPSEAERAARGLIGDEASSD